ncbi:MAG: serine/threonine-protein kinase, partial [Gemmataceae bacterium]
MALSTRTHARAVRAVNDEPIPGYRLVEPLGRGGFGEVWKCEAPGGLFKAIKFVRGGGLDPSCDSAEQELRALDHVKAIRHPFLLSTERFEFVDGDLAIVMELADRSLHDLLVECRAAGKPGIPRWELVAYLREAAEVLDLLNHQYGVTHLDIKPRNVFLVGKHIKVADFGLANSLAELAVGESGRSLGGLTPLYAAPETFQGQASPHSDQYSLAVTYHELLTGEPVFNARNYNQLM